MHLDLGLERDSKERFRNTVKGIELRVGTVEGP